jgi:hypothetical protein
MKMKNALIGMSSVRKPMVIYISQISEELGLYNLA